MQRLQGYIRKACDLYGLIEDGDHVVVGVSGGKDSLALLGGLKGYSRYSKEQFAITAVVLDPCFGGVETDFSPIERYCEELSVPLIIRRSDIGEVAQPAAAQPVQHGDQHQRHQQDHIVQLQRNCQADQTR